MKPTLCLTASCIADAAVLVALGGHLAGILPLPALILSLILASVLAFVLSILEPE